MATDSVFSYLIVVPLPWKQKGGEILNWKIALLLLVVVFTPAVTAVSIGLRAPGLQPIPTMALEKTALCIIFKPLGEPIDNPGGPH